MRLYTFGNYYLSSIQQGIQAAHVVANLFVKYPCKRDGSKLLRDWASDHKTIVCLNGGNAEDLHILRDKMELLDCPYPYASFCEDERSLARALTCVGVVLPEWVYDRPQRSDYQNEEIWRHERKVWAERHHPERFDTWMVSTLDKLSLAR